MPLSVVQRSVHSIKLVEQDFLQEVSTDTHFISSTDILTEGDTDESRTDDSYQEVVPDSQEFFISKELE